MNQHNFQNKPLISTITPFYKMGRFLPYFLENYKSQTIFSKTEVVIDLNEPTEEELHLVKNFQLQNPGRIKILISDPVIPIGVSMNKCIENASGDFLAIWNIDDLRTPSSLERQINVYKKDNRFGISHGNFIIVPSFGNVKGEYVDHSWTNKKQNELTRGMHVGPFFSWRKSLHSVCGYFDENLKSGADFDLAIRLAANTKAFCLDSVLGYYLNERNGLSTNGSGLQETERTVIDMRYGIDIKFNKMFVPSAEKYPIHEITNFGKKYPVSKFIKNFEELKQRNSEK